MGKRSNTFKKAIRHLKSTQIDEKLQMLSEIPVNATSTIYIVEPERNEIVGQNITAPLDLTQDDPAQSGRDTTGLFGEDGSILTEEPPGDTSYILGPMISMWYSWGNFTTIGYVRQSDRRMVNLGSITGRIGNWNGSSLNSYGQLTLAQAQWYRDQYLNGNTQQYRAFYPGPPSNPADQFGRYLGDMIDAAKELAREILSRIPPGLGGFDPNLVPGSAKDKDKKKKKKEDELYGPYPDGKLPTKDSTKPRTDKGFQIDTKWHGTSKDAADKIKQGGFKPTKTGLVPDRVWVGDKNVAGDYSRGGRSSGSMGKNAPDNRTLIPVRTPRGSGTTFPDWGGTQTALPKDVADRGARTGNVQPRGGRRPNPGTVVRTPGLPGGGGSGGGVQPIEPWTPNRNPVTGAKWNPKTKTYSLANSYNPDGRVISESTKSILKNIKKPYVLPEEPKIKFKHKPGIRSIGENLMKTPDIPKEFKPEPNIWRKYDYAKNERLSQEKKNEILDHLGAADHAWEWMTETSRDKNNTIMYGNFDDKNKKEYKVVRKEELKGDTLLFLVDENGKKESILQSDLSCKIADEYDKKLFAQYIEEQENTQIENDPLFKKVSKRLKKEIDYPDKPAKKGYPNDPPPEMVNGWHPKFGDRSDYYNKLDPQSAKAMPYTGNSSIDSKVEKAKKLRLRSRKKKNIIGKKVFLSIRKVI